MNLRFLETFLWVVRLGSFSAAAERMAATQAAVSHRIHTLESDLGFALFDRDGRAARLTAAGRKIVPQAEEILRLVGDMRETEEGAALRGVVSIGTIDSIVYTWLPRFIERLKERYPLVNLELTVGTSLSLTRPVSEGAIDLAMMMGPVQAPGLRNEELGAFPCDWLAARTLDLPAGEMDVADLVAYPLLAYPRHSIPHQALMQLLADARIPPENVRIYDTNSIATLARLVRDGIGVCAMPAIIMREAIETGEVRALAVRQRMPPLMFHAIHRVAPGNPLPQAVAQLAVETARDFERDTHKSFRSRAIE
ncbi:MAG: LysR family transcriptional regulator [Rhizobiales bacterium]|nr:LysR family transcriptional regulator [Hyphomicrobiales bacterium]